MTPLIFWSGNLERFKQVLALVFSLAVAFALGCAGPEHYNPQRGGGFGVYPSPRMWHPRLKGIVTPPTPKPTSSPAAAWGNKVQHIVIIYQENRSFNDLFMSYPGATTSTTGQGFLPPSPFPSAWTPGPDATPTTIPLDPEPFDHCADRGHGLKDFLASWNNGAMNGWVQANKYNPFGSSGCSFTPLKLLERSYGYVPNVYVYVGGDGVTHSCCQAGPYWNIAQNYILGDMNFQSHLDASFVSHQYLIAAQANHSASNPGGVPWGCDVPTERTSVIDINREVIGRQTPCFDFITIGDELDQAGVSWKYYAPTIHPGARHGLGQIWSAYDSISHIRYGPDWARNISSPEQNIFNDIAGGTLPSVAWTAPNLADSDHAGSKSNNGPIWVSAIINAIGQSKYWNSTIIFVAWDDWGGWYDPVPPPQLDYDGLGFRNPLLIVSPYNIGVGRVTHVQYESQGSTLRFIEDMIGLPSMSSSDSRANDPVVEMNLINATPRPFATVSAPPYQNNGDDQTVQVVMPDEE